MGKMTIADIARIAKVSKTTVSRYINGRYESMSDTTRRDLERIIAQANYYPSSAARRLKSGKSMQIGVMVSVTQNSKLLFQTIWGICQALRQNGYTPVIYDNHEGDEAKNLQACLGHDLEGLIFSPSTLDFPIYEKAVKMGMPTVLVDRYHEGWRYDAVYVDHYRAVTEILHHLVAQGYERIGFFCDDCSVASTKMMRQKAFLDFVGDRQGMSGEDGVYRIRKLSQVGKALEDFLGKGAGDHKAVFAADNDVLLEILSFVADHGLAMPTDLGVCGYDSWGWAKLVQPGITSITQPVSEMGEKTVERLLALIKNPEAKRPRLIRLKCRLNIRKSTLLST